MRRAALLACLVLAAACSGDEGAPRRDRLVVGTTENAGALDPATCYDSFCARTLLPNTHEGLVRFEPGSTVPGPALAESWTISDDGLTHTFAIRRGVVFHDGTPLTSATVKRSLERVRALASAQTPAFLLFDTSSDPPLSGIAAIAAPSEQTLVVTLARRDATFLSKLEFPLSSVVPESYPADTIAGDGVLVGTGPYRLAPGGIRRGRSIDLVRNERYWGAAPRTPRVAIRFYRTAREIADALTSGEVDVAFRGVDGAVARSLEDAEDVRTVTGPGAAVRFLVFNVRREPFAKPGVRRAIAAAVDRRALIRQALGDAAMPLFSLVPSGLDAHRDVFRDAAGPGAVAQGLTEAGVPSAQRVAVELWYTPTHYGEAEPMVARALKDSIEGSGSFTVTLRSAEWSEYKSAFTRGDLGAFLLGWFPDYMSAENYLEPFVQGAAAAKIGSNYASPDVDRLLEEAARTPDAARRIEILVQVQQRIADDAPVVPLWQQRQAAFTRASVRGLSFDFSQSLRLSGVRIA